jgi:predicted anti-sigma-YlaC factor YlaD
MKKKNCQEFVEDIAAFASEAELSPEAATHLRNCARCREKIAELKAVAALHREAAANLAEPKRRLSRSKLEFALANGSRRRRELEIRWRPVLAGAVALALIVGGALTHRKPQERVDASYQSKHEQRETKVGEESVEPTMLILRHEVEGERMLAGTTAAATRHYRVKDVERELRN